jgi:hypothetical protein
MLQLFLGGLLLRASGVADSLSFHFLEEIAIVVAAVFIVSLVIGAATEADDVWGPRS